MELSISRGGEVGNAIPYSVHEANRMMEFALASYCCGNLGHGVADWSCQACGYQPQMQNISVCSSGIEKDANGFVGYDPAEQAIIVAFAGTDPLSIVDWIDDLDTIPVSYPACSSSGCKVHQGFWDTYKAIQPLVWSAVNALLKEKGAKTKVQITGHSLGAALATHCAIDFYDSAAIQPNWVYTYGQPRVGNSAFADFYNSKITTHWRVTHHQDPVPHLPPEDFGFWHVVTEVFYPHNPNTTYQICNPSGEDPNCSDKYLVDVNVLDHLDYMGFDITENYLSCKL
jgi:hypothetical protein